MLLLRIMMLSWFPPNYKELEAPPIALIDDEVFTFEVGGIIWMLRYNMIGNEDF